jgi:hypothetical protein
MECSHGQDGSCQSSNKLSVSSAENETSYDSFMAGVPESIWIKIKRADHHIKDLEVRIPKFIGSGPYKTVCYMDAQGCPTYRLSNVKPIDPMISAVAGDAIQNLRAALDYLMCALWSRANDGECKRIQFPCMSAGEYESKGLGEIHGVVRQDAIDAISAVEPYEGGKGELLWRLHRLSIIDKHRLPIAIVGGNLGIHLPSLFPHLFTERERDNPWIILADSRFSLKENDILFRDEPGRELKQDVQFPFFVALDEAGIFEREPLLPCLTRIYEFVAKSVSGFDSLFL